jgi:hypothetical protein
MDQESRRSFVKKSLATSVSLSFVGLIRADGEGDANSTVQTTVQTTDIWETTVDLPIWSIDYTWGDAFEFLVPAQQTESVVNILTKAIEQKHETCPGNPTTIVRAPGGTQLNPYTYGGVTVSINGDNPKFTYDAAYLLWRVEFKAGYVYRETRRE